MGYALKGICYGTQQEALDVFFESVPPTISGSVLTHFLRDGSGNWYIAQGTYASNGAYTQQFAVPAQLPTLAICTNPTSNEEAFSDGQAIGWQMVLACVVCWGIWVLRRGT